MMWERDGQLEGVKRICGARCSICRIEHEYRGDLRAEYGLPARTYLEARLAEFGCHHSDDFVDYGYFDDPRTEWRRTFAFGELSGTVEDFYPICGEGRVGDLYWYFRSRGGAEFAISTTQDLAVRWSIGWGKRTGLGWAMPEDFADPLTIGDAYFAIRKAYITWVEAGRPLLDGATC